jgi:hypothetical protein
VPTGGGLAHRFFRFLPISSDFRMGPTEFRTLTSPTSKRREIVAIRDPGGCYMAARARMTTMRPSPRNHTEDVPAGDMTSAPRGPVPAVAAAASRPSLRRLGLVLPLVLTVIFAVIVALVAPGPASAAIQTLSSEFQINHANPEASIPGVKARNAKPIEFGYFLQDLVTYAQAAARAGDHLSESRYYKAFTKAVPDSRAGFARLCQSLDAAHQREEALAACKQALGLAGATVEDSVRFVHLVLAKPGSSTAAELDDVNAVIANLRGSPETRVAASHLECELGVHLESIPLLTECTQSLTAVAPGDPKTLTFSWALAIRQGDASRARALVARAKAAGMTSEGLSRMERTTFELEHASPWRGLLRQLLDWRRGLLAIAGLAAVAWVGIFLARRRRVVPVKVPLHLGDGRGI